MKTARFQSGLGFGVSGYPSQPQRSEQQALHFEPVHLSSLRLALASKGRAKYGNLLRFRIVGGRVLL